MKELKIAIACGGTGGHTYPGLATARVLQSRGHKVTVLQAGRDIEKKTLDGWDGPVFKTGARQIRPKELPAIFRSILRTYREFGIVRPDAVLAMGSYSSLPAVLAARLRGVPVALHEANAVPGKAVALLARLAKNIGIAFPEARELLPKNVGIFDIGLPLRSEITKGIGTTKAATGGFSLLVMGGSQGARDMNVAVVQAIALLFKNHRDAAVKMHVVHLAGDKNEKSVRELYRALAIPDANFQVLGFSDEMPRHYAEADFCISRAGASSCFELALAGLPALFIPLPHIAGDHQTVNAKSMASRGAGDWRAQSELHTQWLCDYISNIETDKLRRKAMREAMFAVARPDAAMRLADLVEKTTEKQ